MSKKMGKVVLFAGIVNISCFTFNSVFSWKMMRKLTDLVLKSYPGLTPYRIGVDVATFCAAWYAASTVEGLTFGTIFAYLMAKYAEEEFDSFE